MGMESIPGEGWLWFVIVTLVLLNAYNVISTARRNAREEKKRREQPKSEIVKKLDDFAKYLDNDKRRLDDHDRQLGDMRSGLMAVCAGVQALLEHELHNGNTTEMNEASKNIDKWLRERPLPR